MRFVIGFLWMLTAGLAMAAEPVTVTVSETTFDADVVVIPFPDHATTITFAMTDPSAPDAISLRFDYPSTETLAQWMGEVQAAVAGRMSEAEQGTRGMGGDPVIDAIKSVYRDEIAAQENVAGLLQHYLDAVVKIRFRLEMLRQYAAQIQNTGG